MNVRDQKSLVSTSSTIPTYKGGEEVRDIKQERDEAIKKLWHKDTVKKNSKTAQEKIDEMMRKKAKKESKKD